MDRDAAELIADLESRADIEVRVDEVRSRGFDGTETLMYLITAFVGGIGSGMLSKMGEDLWAGMRAVAGSLRRRVRGKTPRTIGIVVHNTPDGPVRFRCDLDDDLTAHDLAEAFRATMTSLESGMPIAMVETEDGIEIRILPVEEADDA